MGTLTVIFVVRIYDIPPAVLLSLVTTSIMFGMKLDKLTMLVHWCGLGPSAVLRRVCRNLHGPRR